jgi:hypothetical protein
MIGFSKPQTGIKVQKPMEEKSEQPKKRVEINVRKRKNIISLWLDDYDNFFSDFDPRPFSQRSLSDDFLYEAKKVTREMKPGVFDVTFLIPHNKRNKPMENVITARLHSHFKKHHCQLEKEQSVIRKKGILLTILGMSLMIGSVIVMEAQTTVPILRFLRVLMEPSGWFCTWYGLDHMFYMSKQNASELEFNKKMMHAEIRFDAY